MFFSYKECIEKFKNDYFLEKALADAKLFKVEREYILIHKLGEIFL